MAVATPERLALAKQVAELHGDPENPLTFVQVAERLGISRSYASELWGDPDGSRTSARKESYRQPCPECGRLMNGSDGITGAPTRCQSCQEDAEKAAKFWTRERVIDAFKRYAAEHDGQAPRADEWIRSNPEKGYPPRSAVSRGRQNPSNPTAPFDTWNDAVFAAGLTPHKVPTTWRRWSDQDILDAIWENSTVRDGVRHAPTPSNIGVKEHRRLQAAAASHFGTWRRACEKAGVRPAGWWAK